VTGELFALIINRPQEVIDLTSPVMKKEKDLSSLRLKKQKEASNNNTSTKGGKSKHQEGNRKENRENQSK
jgi:hypothetical protein